MPGVWTKNLSTWPDSRVQPATAESTACLLHRTASLKRAEFVNCSAPPLARPLPGFYAALRLRVRAGTKGNPHSLKSCRARNANAARAPHTSPATTAPAKPHTNTAADAQTTKLHRPPSTDSHDKTAQALFRTKQGDHVQAETVATAPTPRAGVLRYSLRSSAKTRTTVIRAAGSV